MDKQLTTNSQRVMKWRKKNPYKCALANEKYAPKGKVRRLEIKNEVLTHYGNGRCACVRCGFDDMRALSIDHISGNGNKQRQEIKSKTSGSLYSWLIKGKFPVGFQTLCMNCQFIKRFERNENYKGRGITDSILSKPMMIFRMRRNKPGIEI